ncbi:MSMEG_0565 family glycosyltransferase [Oscillatoria sp. FACHB-1407]|uniref:MSMEG_0565 family glycosyltransferase n=1 Tax=Oscillatoria sp. FACHB-1407 TaxID=2692847 RepID=UPI001686CCF2|nr:MSMEG_0565 family glycosyltransferase [Oscillatoria sp. FACHB-1407]MBD2462675.1 MSMEG_0565 family glycosyltransferase [Oscillatoria sp. FACHB-1407]
MRIALLTYSTKLRGSVVHTLELAEALHDLGHDVTVYALDKDGKGFDRPLSCHQRLIPAAPAPADLDRLIQQRIHEFVVALEQDLRSDALDVYHAQDCIGANALAILRQRQLIPHFARTVHHIEDYSSLYLQQCQDRSIREADLCLCVSQEWQQELHRQYQIEAPRVYNGVNLNRFSPEVNGVESEVKQRFGLQGLPLYLTIGGIEPRKNSIALLQAFAQVLPHQPQAQLVIAGGSTLFDYHTYRDEFFANVQALGIPDAALVVTGVIPDRLLPVLYRTADAFVFPSVKEGWGLVVLEAIASGLPVVTSNQPPFTEFLSPEQALLVDPLSPQAIAQAMLAVTRPEVTRSLVQQSQSVLSTYTWVASAQVHLRHYAQLLKDKGKDEG